VKVNYPGLKERPLGGAPTKIAPINSRAGLNILPVAVALDIENLGEAVVGQLVDSHLVTSLDDLYRLDSSQLLALEGFADKSANNLIDAIERSKTQDFWRIICGLGIKHVGTSASKDLVRTFSDWRQLVEASLEDFTAIDGIGEIMAESLVEFFQNTLNLSMLESMESLGVVLKNDQAEALSTPLDRRHICAYWILGEVFEAGCHSTNRGTWWEGLVQCKQKNELCRRRSWCRVQTQ
jgi:NAD-dependent DNA ligase